MKQIIILFLLVVFTSNAKADQLAVVTKKQAVDAVNYIKTHHIKKIAQWCSCCDKDKQIFIGIKTIYYRATSNPNEYEVIVQCTDTSEINLDLAYIWILSGPNKYKNFSTLLGIEADICSTDTVEF